MEKRQSAESGYAVFNFSASGQLQGLVHIGSFSKVESVHSTGKGWAARLEDAFPWETTLPQTSFLFVDCQVRVLEFFRGGLIPRQSAIL